jgi:hypothetical protein
MDATTKSRVKSIINKVHRDFRISDTGWYSDAASWVQDALSEIGTPYVLEHCTKTAKSIEGKIKLPCHIDLFIGVKQGNCFLTRINKKIKANGVTIKDKYEIKGCYIMVDYLDGTEFEIHYKTFPLDEEGYPEVPDMQSVKEAISWKIVLMLLQGGYQHPTVTYQFAFDRYNSYKDKASNDLMMPSPSDMGQIGEEWRSPFLTFNNNPKIYES